MWKVLRTSVAGSSHVKSGAPCQDAHAAATAGDSLILACADGAGSASSSEIGASLACEVLVESARSLLEMMPQLEEEELLELFRVARKAVEQRAEELQLAKRELACTLLVAVAGPREAIFGQVGDGLIVVREGEGYVPVIWPDIGEHLNDTHFLTDDDFEENFAFARRAPPAEISLTTDGLQMLAANFAAKTVHAGFYQPFFQQVREAKRPEDLLRPLEEFLASGPINDRTDDDKTLILAVRDAVR